jgi:uncharacterized membrane protein (DUF373 family)
MDNNKRSRFYDRVARYLINAIHGIEILLAGLVIVAVLISVWGIISSGSLQGMEMQQNSIQYKTFQDFLAFILLLLVGLELAIMLVKHTTESVVEVMLYAVARKMLIYSSATTDMLIGVIALAALFAVKFYLLREKRPDQPTQILAPDEPTTGQPKQLSQKK